MPKLKSKNKSIETKNVQIETKKNTSVESMESVIQEMSNDIDRILKSTPKVIARKGELTENQKNDVEIARKMFENTDNNEKVINKIKSEDEDLTLSQKMDEMWYTLKQLIKQNPKFMDIPDKEKLDVFRHKPGYTQLMDDHPIVTRYLICMGQYNAKAFRKYLYVIKNTKMPPPEKRNKGDMENVWITMQAKYVRYLWEAYQKHPSPTDAARVESDTFHKLKGEFDEFREMYKKVEDKVKDDKIINQGKNLRDVLERLKTGKQSLSEEETKELVVKLQDQLYKKRSKKMLQQILKDVKYIEPTHKGIGNGAPDQDLEKKDKPTITMIETVDSEKYDLIDDKYKRPTSQDELIQKIKQSEVIPEEYYDEEIEV